MTQLDQRIRAEQPDPTLPATFYGDFAERDYDNVGADVDADEDQE